MKMFRTPSNVRRVMLVPLDWVELELDCWSPCYHMQVVSAVGFNACKNVASWNVWRREVNEVLCKQSLISPKTRLGAQAIGPSFYRFPGRRLH